MDPRLEALIDKQEITEVILKVARATDRGDLELYRASFARNGEDYHGLTNGPVEQIIEVLSRTKLKVLQHLVSNTLIDLRGETAQAETCFNAVHQDTGPDGRLVNEYLRGRYLDLLSREDGAWKISRRVVLWDWSRVETAEETWFERILQRPGVDDRFVYSRRDRLDMLYTDELPPELRARP